MNPQPSNPLSEELEARVVAMILGECSAFERATLEKEIAASPELERFAAEAAALHAMLPPAVGCKNLPRLSPSRRRALLRRMKSLPDETSAVARADGKLLRPAPQSTVPGRWKPSFWSIALPLAAAIILALLLLPSSTEYRHSDFDIPDFEGESGSFVMAMDESEKRDADALVDVSSFDFKVSDGIASASPPAGLSRQLAISAPQSVVASAPAPPAPNAAPSAGVAVASTSEVAQVPQPMVASQIKEFTLGWGKGAGTGTGVRNRLFESADSGGRVARLQRAGDLPEEAKSKAVSAGIKRAEEPARTGDRPFWEFETAAAPVSTFSLHVADVSFQLAEEALLRPEGPQKPEGVRVEEFTAAFSYGELSPAEGEAVAIASQQARDPFVPGANLLRLSVRVGSDGRAGGTPLNLVLLLDKSGSMERPDRMAAAENALRALFESLSPEDRVTLVTFDRGVRLVVDREAPAEAKAAILATWKASGESGTNLGEALAGTRKIAAERRSAGHSNRLLLITDGVANLGETLPGNLATEIERLRSSGFSTDVLAVGARESGDAALAAMARKGDGRHFLLADGDADADALARRLAGAFSPAAMDVKVQVRFNPRRVAAYSLLGFDAHRLREEDFRDDAVDAAELSAAEQATAMYRMRILDEGEGEIGAVFVRYRDTATGRIVEQSRIIPFDPSTPSLERAPAHMRLAACATLLGERLAGTPAGQSVDLEELKNLCADLPGLYPENQRVFRLYQMIQAANNL